VTDASDHALQAGRPPVLYSNSRWQANFCLPRGAPLPCGMTSAPGKACTQLRWARIFPGNAAQSVIWSCTAPQHNDEVIARYAGLRFHLKVQPPYPADCAPAEMATT